MVSPASSPPHNLSQEQWKKIWQSLYSENLLYESVFTSLQLSILISDSLHKVLYYSPVTPKVLEVNLRHKKDFIWNFVKNPELASFLKQSLENNDTFLDQEFIQKNSIVSLSLSPYVQAGKLHGNILYVKDITAQKAEQNNQEGSEALETLIRMSAGMAHEIKNPLGSISLHGQILEKSIERKAEKEKLLHHTQIILEEIERLTGIVNQYLFALRPLNLPLTPLSLNDLVKKTLDFVTYEMQQDHIRIHYELQEPLPAILLNERYFKQALLNLLENARFALSLQENSKNRILRVRTYMRENWVNLDIEDNGVGMDAQSQNNFFKPYFSTKEGSSGLGMSIIFKIIKEHKGKISFRSSEEMGTVFTLSFPIYQEKRSMISFGESHDSNSHRG
jgi:signal transduction histidine kinase